MSLPVEIIPSDSVAFVGDTLWIIANVSDSLLEFNTQKKYKLANFDFGQTSIVIRKLVDRKLPLSAQVGAATKFGLVEEIGRITFPGETFIDFNYEYDVMGERYSLRIGIIPQEQGVFCINFLSPKELLYNDVINLGKHPNGATIIPVYEDLVFPINHGANNFEIFTQNCLDISDGPPENYRTNYRYVTFTFRVR